MHERDWAVRWVIEGKVQGVGFRYFTCEAALDLGLCGTVRNLEDGSVEVLVSGSTAGVAALRARVAEGPSWAEVTQIVESEIESVHLPVPFEVCL